MSITTLATTATTELTYISVYISVDHLLDVEFLSGSGKLAEVPHQRQHALWYRLHTIYQVTHWDVS